MTKCPIQQGQIDLPLLRLALSPAFGDEVDALCAAQMDAADSVTAQTGRIMLDWSDQQARGLPDSLFFKLCRSDSFDGQSEIDFYTRDYADLPDAPLPICHAHGHLQDGGYWLLLQDLSATHRDNKDIRPDTAIVSGFAQSIGRLHAHHFNARSDSADQFRRFMGHVSTGLSPLFEHLEDDLSAPDRDLIQHVFDTHPDRMLARLADAHGQCLLHGDANPTNLLSPITGEGQHYLIDRQPFDWSLRNGPGAIDLITQSVPFWPRADRRMHEGKLLSVYHQALGQSGYSLQDLWDDYRLCLPHTLYMAVEWCSDPEDLTGMQWLWQAQLQRALDALKQHWII
ncbi:MAG: hypothetical protein Alpg2KO_27330 [Alphaproteobacteria bacterium]